MVGWLGTHGVRTVTAHIHPEHDASAAVADRVGLKPTLTVEDGERLWRMHLDPRLPSPAEQRRNLGRLNVLGGLGLIGFALFEIVMARNGALPGRARPVGPRHDPHRRRDRADRGRAPRSAGGDRPH